MSYYVLTQICQVISLTTVQRVTNLESQTEENQIRFQEFDNEIKQCLNEDDYPTNGDKTHPHEWAAYVNAGEFDVDFQEEFDFVINNEVVPEADEEFTPDTYDNY
jgi:hypothetical protein